MARFNDNSGHARVLGLGNDLLADDAFGLVAARVLRRRLPDEVEVLESGESGFGLFEALLGVERLVVVDTIVSGRAAPGAVFVLEEGDLVGGRGGSPHYVGLLEALAAARQLESAAVERVDFVAVEAADVTTVGGRMHQAVRRALPAVVRRVSELLGPLPERGPSAPDERRWP